MLNINGLNELKTFEGTRTQIYEKIHELNPMAIIDNRTATAIINNKTYLIILKKNGKNFKINIIWDIDNNEQHEI